MSGTKLYRIWSSMKHRCLNPADKHYANYGGRGIRICDEWLVFENFLEWARASGYREGLTIERINNDGNYEPGNCKWVPKPEQSNNTRRSKLVTFRGRTMTLKDWAEELGLPYHLLQVRLTKYGWSVERAFTTPAIPQHRSHVRLIEWQGETKSIAEWARFFGISEKLLYRRLAAGWSFERAVTEPIDKRKRRVAAATGVPVYVAPA
ncbi:hypothetical protein [Symbiobacterium terraclitae]|uniref:hypothetical protein n=1 Tax=Symbiobacterium terraclitae TaxID=557451 RepID=UPI0035B55747